MEDDGMAMAPGVTFNALLAENPGGFGLTDRQFAEKAAECREKHGKPPVVTEGELVRMARSTLLWHLTNGEPEHQLAAATYVLNTIIAEPE
jgi:hypothetical protein